MYMYIWLCNVPLRIYSKIKCCILCQSCRISFFLNVTQHWGVSVHTVSWTHQKHIIHNICVTFYYLQYLRIAQLNVLLVAVTFPNSESVKRWSQSWVFPPCSTSGWFSWWMHAVISPHYLLHLLPVMLPAHEGFLAPETVITSTSGCNQVSPWRDIKSSACLRYAVRLYIIPLTHFLRKIWAMSTQWTVQAPWWLPVVSVHPGKCPRTPPVTLWM